VFVDPAAMLEATLGASVIALEAERAEIEKMPVEKAVETIKAAVNRGVAHGLRELGRDMGRYAEGLENIARAWTGGERR
jgi:hypothetical protein